MVRLMLVLAPVMCILSGIAVSHLLSKYIKNVDPLSVTTPFGAQPTTQEKLKRPRKHEQQQSTIKNEIAIGFVFVMSFLLVSYCFHCTWVTSEAYSSPSIVLSARSHDGSRIIFDDFR